MHRIIGLFEQLITAVEEKEQELREANRDTESELVQLAEARTFIRELEELIDKHGLATAAKCFKLVPIASCKGNSGAELDLMLDRMDRGLIASAFVTHDPRNKRFPVEVIGTGAIGPRGLDMAVVPEARSAS